MKSTAAKIATVTFAFALAGTQVFAGGGDAKSAKPAHAKAATQAVAEKAYGVGATVEDFSLLEPKSGKETKLSQVAGKNATVVVFYNQECPFVQEAQPRIADFAKSISDKGVSVVAIDVGVVNSADEIKDHAKEQPFTVLSNPDSKVAAKFGATHTPEVYVLDKSMKVVYHGAFDNGKRADKDGRKSYTADAVQAVLEGKEPSVKKVPAFGCSVKYADGVKPGECCDKEAKS